MKLSHSVIYLLLLKSLIKKVIYNMGIDSEKLKFVSSYNLYDNNSKTIVAKTITRMTSISNIIDVKYNWSRHNVGK